MSMERNHLWMVLLSFIFSLNQMRSTGYVVSCYIHTFLETHGFISFRLNKQSERLRGCLSRHLRLRCRQKCVTQPVPWADIAFSRLTTMTMSLIIVQKSHYLKYHDSHSSTVCNIFAYMSFTIPSHRPCRISCCTWLFQRGFPNIYFLGARATCTQQLTPPFNPFMPSQLNHFTNSINGLSQIP